MPRHHVLRVSNRLDQEVPLLGGEMLLEDGLLEEMSDIVDHVSQ